jgi:hypothetical protein
VTSRGRVLVAGLGDVSGTDLTELQWPLFEAFSRPVVIVEGVPDRLPGESPWADDPDPAARLLDRLGLTADDSPEALVAVSARPLFGGVSEVAVFPHSSPKSVFIDASAFATPRRLLQALLHSLGHAFGLACCADPACAMSAWQETASADEPGPLRFCALCRRKLQKGLRTSS